MKLVLKLKWNQRAGESSTHFLVQAKFLGGHKTALYFYSPQSGSNAD